MVFAIRRAWVVSSGSPLLNLLTAPGITLLYTPILLKDPSLSLYHPPGIGVGVGVGVRVGAGVFVGPAGVGVRVGVGVGAPQGIDIFLDVDQPEAVQPPTLEFLALMQDK